MLVLVWYRQTATLINVVINALDSYMQTALSAINFIYYFNISSTSATLLVVR